MAAISLNAFLVAGCGDGPTAESGGAGGSTTGSQTGGTGTAGTGTGATGTGGSAGAPGGGGAGGGTGGTGDTTSSSGGTGGVGGVGGAAADAVCNAICDPATCVGNICARPPWFDVSLMEGHTSLGGASTDVAFAQALLSSAATFQIDVAAIDGDCAIVKVTVIDGGDKLAFDAGAVTIDDPTAGMIVLPPGGVNGQFLQLPVDGAFSPGESISFDISGGADVPAVSADIVAPEDLVLSVPAIQAGQPLVVSWTPAPPPKWLLITGAAAAIFCAPGLPGEFTVPAALTAQLGPASGNASVNALRASSFQTDFGGAGPLTTLSARVEVGLAVPYTP